MSLVSNIPPKFIIEIVDKNVIANAVALPDNPYMKYLFVIWYNYIEPNSEGDISCGYCRNSVLNNFRSMVSEFKNEYTNIKSLEEL